MDGHAGCGKSSTAKALANKLDYIYIDTGAMYRAVTLYLLQHNIPIDNQQEVEKELSNVHLSFAHNPSNGRKEIELNGMIVEEQIRTLNVSSKVSKVSSIPAVRHFLVEQQQAMGKQKGIVMDGRDIGTVVFPDAELKIFMTASAEVRAKRRQLEMEEKGQKVAFEDVLNDLVSRDKEDSSRAESPLKKADDAIEVDTSNCTFEEQLDKVYQLAIDAIQ
ncbi:(d)CMP kinase [Algivirga pacifica]|uniref:Cytidylate kinase n=2 Tax=Algivirga pacifica TaxID=1162670 RepID=A0ABP9DFK7_9BACT